MTPEQITEELRRKPNYEKGVAVGLLVGIEDTMKSVDFLIGRARTNKDKGDLELIRYHLEGSRDRLVRVITSEWIAEKEEYEMVKK